MNLSFFAYGVRALSRYHLDHPYEVSVNGQVNRVNTSQRSQRQGLFGGNSNWRGPIWLPVNYLLIESPQSFITILAGFQSGMPTNSGRECDLCRSRGDFAPPGAHFPGGEDGRRPVAGGTEVFQNDPHWKDLILFYEYFHGDNGRRHRRKSSDRLDWLVPSSSNKVASIR